MTGALLNMERSERNPNEPELIEMRPEQTGMRPEWSGMDRNELEGTEKRPEQRIGMESTGMRWNETE